MITCCGGGDGDRSREPHRVGILPFTSTTNDVNRMAKFDFMILHVSIYVADERTRGMLGLFDSTHEAQPSDLNSVEAEKWGENFKLLPSADRCGRK